MGGGDHRMGTVTGAVQRYAMGGSPCARFAASDTVESYDTSLAP
jgi:hypothetical protein